MIDQLYEELNLRHLVDWGVIVQGVAGVPGIPERLALSRVADFANCELERISINDPLLSVIVDLATNSEITTVELREALETICSEKKVDLNKSARKWRAISLNGVLADLDSDSLYGLIKISEFWSCWGWPKDMPTCMSADNEMSSQDYHSEANYERVIANHLDWITNEFASIN